MVVPDVIARMMRPHPMATHAHLRQHRPNRLTNGRRQASAPSGAHLLVPPHTWSGEPVCKADVQRFEGKEHRPCEQVIVCPLDLDHDAQ